MHNTRAVHLLSPIDVKFDGIFFLKELSLSAIVLQYPKFHSLPSFIHRIFIEPSTAVGTWDSAVKKERVPVILECSSYGVMSLSHVRWWSELRRKEIWRGGRSGERSAI